MRRKKAIEFMNQGVVATCGSNGQPANTQIGYQLIGSAIQADPTLAQAHYVMGNANSDLQLKNAAVANYRRALQTPKTGELGDLTDETRVNVLVNMAHSLFHMGRHTEAMQCTVESLALDDTKAMAWCNKSMIHSVRGEDELAVEAAKRAVELDKTAPSADRKPAVVEMALAFSLLNNKQYRKGLKHFEARFAYKLHQFLQYPYPQWKGEAGADLFLLSDQGMGDSIDFLRFVPMAQKRCKKIWLGAQPELIRVMAAMFSKYDNIHYLALPQPFPPASHWSALMSLPTALDLHHDKIVGTPMPKFDILPHIPDWKREGPKLHVGIAWAGARLNDLDQWRSIAVEHFLELCRVPNVHFYSLQVGERGQEMHSAGAASLITDITPYIRDVMDTASIMQHLDLVITVDTSVGHIAGMIGKPCWIPASFNGCCWRFTRHGTKSLWYPNHVIYRQKEDCDWRPVFDSMASDLDVLTNGSPMHVNGGGDATAQRQIESHDFV